MTNPNKFHKDDLPNHDGMNAVTGAGPEFNHLSDAQMALLGTGSGGSGGVRKDSETLIWNNVLKDWQVDFTPNFTTGVVMVLSDGFLLEYGEDFTVVGDIITFTLAPAKWTFIVEFFSSPIAAIYEDKDMLWDAVETVWDLTFEPDVGYPVVITRDGVECSLGTIAGGFDVELTGPAQLTFAQAPTSWTHIVNWKDAIPAGIENHNDMNNIQGGVVSERYHLTLGQYNSIQEPLDPLYFGNIQTDFLVKNEIVLADYVDSYVFPTTNNTTVRVIQHQYASKIMSIIPGLSYIKTTARLGVKTGAHTLLTFGATGDPSMPVEIGDGVIGAPHTLFTTPGGTSANGALPDYYSGWYAEDITGSGVSASVYAPSVSTYYEPYFWAFLNINITNCVDVGSDGRFNMSWQYQAGHISILSAMWPGGAVDPLWLTPHDFIMTVGLA